MNALAAIMGGGEAMLADGFDDAIVGVGIVQGRSVVFYSRRLCIEILAQEMGDQEAEDFYEFNVAGAYVGPGTPIFLDIP